MSFRLSAESAPNESWWKVFIRRLELMFWAVVGPELITLGHLVVKRISEER